MGRNGDLPGTLGRLDGGGHPRAAVLAVGAFVALLALIGDVRLTWSISAFTVLIYYAVTNLSALRLTREQRLYPTFVAVLGLGGCLFLAFWVERAVWLGGAGVLLALLALRTVLGRAR
jgi:APA family basic amino acid/polyamine antiporter